MSDVLTTIEVAKVIKCLTTTRSSGRVNCSHYEIDFVCRGVITSNTTTQCRSSRGESAVKVGLCLRQSTIKELGNMECLGSVMRSALITKGESHTNTFAIYRTQCCQLRPDDIHLARVSISDRYSKSVSRLCIGSTCAGTEVHCAVRHTIDMDFLSNLIVMTYKVDTLKNSRCASYIELYTQICLLGSNFRSNVLNVNNVKSFLKTLITFTVTGKINSNRFIFASNIFIGSVCLSNSKFEEVIIYLIDEV